MYQRSKDIKDLTMEKPYLSIGEVAEKFDVSTDLLRKWEAAFPRYLHPRRTGRDSRLYNHKDVQQVAAIYRLIRIEGLSIDGAKRRLSQGDVSELQDRQEVIQRLQMLRQRLLGIIEELGPVQTQTQISYTPYQEAAAEHPE